MKANVNYCFLTWATVMVKLDVFLLQFLSRVQNIPEDNHNLFYWTEITG